MIQFIRRGDGPVIIFDCKGTPELFQTARIEAQRAGRTFKWFTNRANRSTYVFNPWLQRFVPRLSMQDVLGLMTQSLNLVHGSDYGRAWFGISARILLKRALELATGRDAFGSGRRVPSGNQSRRLNGPVESFIELEDCIRAVASNSDELHAAQHLAFIVESLAEYKQLNLTHRLHPGHPALEHAIHWPDVINERQVIYFNLVAAADIASVGQIARLALSSLDFAAMDHHDQTGEIPRIYTLVDEAQVIVAKNVENMLAQVRSHGIACLMAHQSMSQLNQPGGIDLRELFMNCTSVKQIFGVRDPWLIRYISEMSGQVKYYHRAYQQSPADLLSGRVGPQYAAIDEDGRRRVGVQEYFGPRLTPERIHDISRDPNLSILAVERAEGLSQFHGFFPVYNGWPISAPEFDRRVKLPWPEMSDATVAMDSIWPEDGEGTVTPTSHPPIAPDEEIDASELLRRIKCRLEDQ
jgi:hypothetical protein